MGHRFIHRPLAIDLRLREAGGTDQLLGASRGLRAVDRQTFGPRLIPGGLHGSNEPFVFPWFDPNPEIDECGHGGTSGPTIRRSCRTRSGRLEPAAAQPVTLATSA
jgi:hypothetical protein